MRLNIVSTGHVWLPEVARAAMLRNAAFCWIGEGALLRPGPVFFVPNQFPADTLMRDKISAERLAPELKRQLVQDITQIRVYEDKLAQVELWGSFMPATWTAFTWERALELLAAVEFPLISKSAAGSASLNVRLLKDRGAAYAELKQAFGAGIPIRRGPGPDALQQGYVLWQEFIPHEHTYRVTIVGTKLHVYKRFNYDDRPMACPSKVKQTQPVKFFAEVDSLLEFSRHLFATMGTKWCAIDVLKHGDGWRLLETSLAWARGNDPAGNAPFFESTHSLNTQFELMLDELDRGAWA